MILGIEGFVTGSAIDIQLHDTYFVVYSTQFAVVIGTMIFFLIYLVRVLIMKFENIVANLILMVSTVFLILNLMGIESMLSSMQDVGGWASFPSLDEVNSESIENNLDVLSNTLFYLQIFLLIFLAYCGFTTGRNYKLKRENTMHNNS